MNKYPDVVAQIVDDYLQRVEKKLQSVPAFEQMEFLRELQSHIYEAFQQAPGDDAICRMLNVLRNLGEPSEVVSDRLPVSMLRSRSKLKWLFYVLGGLMIALLGIPLGFSGIGVVVGLLTGLAACLIAYYAVAGSVLVAGGLCLLIGIARLYNPAVWDALLRSGMIETGPADGLFNLLPPATQGLAMILMAGVLIALGISLLWLGKRILRGLRFVFERIFVWLGRGPDPIRVRFARRMKSVWNSASPFKPAFNNGLRA